MITLCLSRRSTGLVCGTNRQFVPLSCALLILLNLYTEMPFLCSWWSTERSFKCVFQYFASGTWHHSSSVSREHMSNPRPSGQIQPAGSFHMASASLFTLYRIQSRSATSWLLLCATCRGSHLKVPKLLISISHWFRNKNDWKPH